GWLIVSYLLGVSVPELSPKRIAPAANAPVLKKNAAMPLSSDHLRLHARCRLRVCIHGAKRAELAFVARVLQQVAPGRTHALATRTSPGGGRSGIGSTSIWPQAITSMAVNNDVAPRKDVPCISVAIRSFVLGSNTAIEI